MRTARIRGSTLAKTLAAVLLSWCAIEAPAGDYGIHASFDGTSLELRITLPVFCVQVSTMVLDQATNVRLVSLCARCGGRRERPWS